jgi:hypothetical protein
MEARKMEIDRDKGGRGLRSEGIRLEGRSEGTADKML